MQNPPVPPSSGIRASGFKEIPGVVASGENGIETSADGRWVFIDIWPEKRVLRVDLTGVEATRSIALDFMPDNIRRHAGWQPPGGWTHFGLQGA